MAAVVADTHAVLWMLLDSERLSEPARVALHNAVQTGAQIYVSSISLVEVVYLVEKRKLPETALHQLVAALRSPGYGLGVVPLDQNVAETVRTVSRETVPDMPDRIIAATALFMNLPLVTRDAKISNPKLNTIW